MNKVYFVLFSCMVVALGQNINWAQRGRVRDNEGWFSSVMQETVFELERRGFSNMKLSNITKNINEQMYRWLVNGTAVYTDGFLAGIEAIDVTNIMSQVGNPTVNGRPDPRAFVNGRLNLRNPRLGYDVIFTPGDGSAPLRYTGEYTLTWITWQFSLTKNYTSNALTMLSTLSTSAPGLGRMAYRPDTNVTEVLSRHFVPGDTYDGIFSWRRILEEIILDVINNKIPFPPICYGQC